LRWRTFLTFGSRRSSTVPPAASIFSRADAEQLHVGARVLDHALLDERLGRHLVAGLEPVEVAEVDGLGGCAERADRHRVLGGRAAQFAEPHVDLRLASLEARRHLVRARA